MSIYKLTRYVYFSKEKLRKYPTLRLHEDPSYHYLSLAEAEKRMLDDVEVENSCVVRHKIVYAYVIIEIPIDMPYLEGECMSQRVYSSNGTLWGEQPYSLPLHRCGTIMRMKDCQHNFNGRSADELKFKVGDIVEVFCYRENQFWSGVTAELAIITKLPPTQEDIANGASISDEYEIIAASNPGVTDYSPVVATFPPSLPVSQRRLNSLRNQAGLHELQE